MRRTAALLTNQSADLWRWIRHFGDFVTIPLAIVVLASVGGTSRLPLVVVGLAAWTLVEYLMHRFVFHRFPIGTRLHQLHHDRPSDPDAERSSLSTPLVAAPFGLALWGAFGLEDGSSMFAGLLAGYLVFIAVHHIVHRWPVGPDSWLYSIKLRHVAHHRQEDRNFGVTSGFWDVVFRTGASAVSGRAARVPASE
jgi:sterol desaturase/sphingolipid hydroxylase (fatty acid hydroxylase superfamily)